LVVSQLLNEGVGDYCYRRIRQDIIFGRLAPGERLKLERMKDDYDVSLSTIRELLNRLSSEGLIVAEGRRGFEVSPVSEKDLRELASMRLLLESHALRNSFAEGDIDWEGRVVGAHHKLALLERKMLDGDHSQAQTWKRYDREFHHELISACGLSALLETHATIYDNYLRYQIVAFIFRGKIAADEHRSMLECALKRDSEKAISVLETHIHGCVEETVARGLLA